jgi:adenylate cyclase class 2
VIEAELKARVPDPEALLAALDQRAAAERATYSDTYFDTADRALTGDGRELRLRVVDREGLRTCWLTYKEAAVPGTGSKPEHETSVADRSVLATLFAGLGLTVLVELTKHCTNYRFDRAARSVLATVVTVPELAGTFIEVETQVPTAAEVPAALGTLRDLLAELGIGEADLDGRDYTDLVIRARADGPG